MSQRWKKSALDTQRYFRGHLRNILEPLRRQDRSRPILGTFLINTRCDSWWSSCIRHFNRQIGEWLFYLNSRGIRRPTLLVLCSEQVKDWDSAVYTFLRQHTAVAFHRSLLFILIWCDLELSNHNQPITTNYEVVEAGGDCYEIHLVLKYKSYHI